MRNFFVQVVAGIIGLWLSVKLVPPVEFNGPWLTLIGAGAVLGFLNFTLRPILELITLPLRLLTLGLFSLVISIAMVWLVDIFFSQLVIPGVLPLVLTAAINWVLIILMVVILPKKRHPVG